MSFDEEPHNDAAALEQFREMARSSNVPDLAVLQAVWFESGFAGCETYALRLMFSGVECFTVGTLSGCDETSGIELPRLSILPNGTLKAIDPDTLPKDFRQWVDPLYGANLACPSEAERDDMFRTSVFILDREPYELVRTQDGSPSIFYATQFQSLGHVERGRSGSTDLVAVQSGQVLIMAVPMSKRSCE